MKKGLALLLCVCLALTALAGCSGKTKEMQKVTVCEVTHSIFYAPQYVALAKGFFADEGLDVELSNGGGADKVMSAVLSGNVDIGFAGAGGQHLCIQRGQRGLHRGVCAGNEMRRQLFGGARKGRQLYLG